MDQGPRGTRVIIDTLGGTIEVPDRIERCKGRKRNQPDGVIAPATNSGSVAAAQTSRSGKRSHCHIDLGLAILCTKEYSLPIGVGRTVDEIAAFCGCSRQRIDQIYQRALRRLRNKVRFNRDPVLKEIIATLLK